MILWFPQLEACERLRMELRRAKVLKVVVICLSRTMKGHKIGVMTWIRWTTRLQKRIHQFIIEVPNIFFFSEKNFWWKKHQPTVLNHSAIPSLTTFNVYIYISS